MTRGRTVFISHGGGPLPLLGEPGHAQMVASLEDIAARLPRPDAILIISAHWEEAVPTVTTAAKPPLIYDYYNFPPESYEIRYPAPGEPELAQQVLQLLATAGIEARADAQRGFDHGVFVPLKIMYPDADIPCVQLSLADNMDPGLHIAIGAALAPLQESNVLVLGSGSTFHNMQTMSSPMTAEQTSDSEAFEEWLRETCSSSELSQAERSERLRHWSAVPGGRFSHPREEHLLPLHVCVGAAGTVGAEVFDVTIMGKRLSMYLW